MRVALAAGLSLSAVLLAGCSGPGDSGDAAPPAPTSSSPAGLEVTELDAGPVGVADVAGTAWTALVDEGTVRTADDDRIAVGDAPLRLVSTPDGVWVSVIRDGTVVRIDPATGKVAQTVRLRPAGSEPEGVAWDGRRLWVVDQAHDRVVPLAPDGTQLVATEVDDEPRLVSTGPSGTWVTSYAGSALTLVDRDRSRTVPLAGCVGPQGVAEAGGRVWVACTLSGKVVALDARSMEQVTEIDDVPDADAVVATGDTVYVVGQSGPTVYVIDAANGELTDTVALDDATPTNENVGAAVVGDDLVVTHPDERKIYTIPLP
jgi:DNA-binding beta-propeller fold protein YncE